MFSTCNIKVSIWLNSRHCLPDHYHYWCTSICFNLLDALNACIIFPQLTNFFHHPDYKKASEHSEEKSQKHRGIMPITVPYVLSKRINREICIFWTSTHILIIHIKIRNISKEKVCTHNRKRILGNKIYCFQLTNFFR